MKTSGRLRKNDVKLAAGVGLGILLGFGGAGVGVFFALQATTPEKPREPLPVRIDSQGPYWVLATEAADRDFAGAIQKARLLHPEATYRTFSPEGVESLWESLRETPPRYALIVIKPEELDVNFAWKWLGVATQIDDDPLLDVSTGFITGATPEAAEQFIERIAKAARGELTLPGKLVDNLGPNMLANRDQFVEQRGCFMIPVYSDRTALGSISHGAAAFTDERLGAMHNAGLVHFGGHGYPDRIVDGLTGRQAKTLQLAPCVVFNGACYTGVTGRWFEQWTAQGTVSEQRVAPEESFCLNLLQNNAVAYLAALHPDHGIPVYQEMEYLAYRGASLGDVMRHTHNGVILGNGGKLPAFEPFVHETPSPQWTPADVMLWGTAARVLFGDPAMIVGEAFTGEPFEIAVTENKSGELHIAAVLSNIDLKSEYTDTYHADLSSDKQLFNDRALIVVDLPPGWRAVQSVAVESLQVGNEELPHRLVGYAVETDGDIRRLHVQVDAPTTGYMQSPFRRQGATLKLSVRR